MDTITPSDNDLQELLDKHIEILQNIHDVQIAEIDRVEIFNTKVFVWYKAFLEEQRQQTKYLANISAAAILFVILTLVSLAIGFCIGTGFL